MEGSIKHFKRGKTLFYKLLIKNRNKKYIFNESSSIYGESQKKIFDINPTIFYKPFEIEIDYDINVYQSNPVAPIGLFCCRNTNESNTPSIHIMASNQKLNIDMSAIGSSDRITGAIPLNSKGVIKIQYNEGIIKVYLDDVLKATFDKSAHKLTSGLSNKCALGQSYTTSTDTMANGLRGNIKVKIVTLK